MKTTIKFFLCIVISHLLVSGCKKDNTPDNYLKIGDNVYEFSAGSLKNWGSESAAFNLDLRLFSGGIQCEDNGGYWNHTGSGQLIYFEMYTSASSGLDSRDFVLDPFGANAVGTIQRTYYCLDFNNGAGTFVYLSTATITVSKSGNEYEIKIEGTDSNDKVISGYFKGEIPVRTDS